MLKLSNLEKFPQIESAEIIYGIHSKQFALVVTEKNGQLYGSTSTSITNAKKKFTLKYGKGGNWD